MKKPVFYTEVSYVLAILFIALGVALAAKKNGIKAIICLPDGAPISKVEATKNYGAEVCLVELEILACDLLDSIKHYGLTVRKVIHDNDIVACVLHFHTSVTAYVACATCN